MDLQLFVNLFLVLRGLKLDMVSQRCSCKCSIEGNNVVCCFCGRDGAVS